MNPTKKINTPRDITTKFTWYGWVIKKIIIWALDRPFYKIYDGKDLIQTGTLQSYLGRLFKPIDRSTLPKTVILKKNEPERKV